MTDDGFKLGKHLVGKCKHNKAAVEAVLATRPAARAVYERELAKYEAKKDDSMPTRKAEALADHLEREGKAPPKRFVTDDGFKLGQFWNGLMGKRKYNKAAVEAVLATRPAAKAVYERELAKREVRKDGILIARNAEALADHLERKGKAPQRNTVTDDGFKLGKFWDSLVGKRKVNKAAVEAVLATRPAAKAVYERELAKREVRKDGTLIARKAEALAKHLEREGKAPPSRFETDDGIKLGGFWEKLVGKRKHNKAAVEAVLATRPAARAVYERELRKRKDRETTEATDGARAAKRARRCARARARA